MWKSISTRAVEDRRVGSGRRHVPRDRRGFGVKRGEKSQTR